MIRHALVALVIHYNPGGIVEDFAKHIRHEHRQVRIVGECESACTMYLGARNVCVAPEAEIMFHQAFTFTGSLENPKHIRPSRLGTARMEAFWPARVRAAIHPPAPPRELWLTGADLIGLGVKKCD